MAIRDLGESLLGKQRKARRKLERRTIIAGAVLPAIQSAIEQSADRKDRELLSTNPSAMEVAANFQIAGKNSDELNKINEEIIKSNKSDSDYFYGSIYDPFKARAEIELQRRGDYDVIGDAGPFNAMIDTEVRKLANQQAKEFREAFDAIQTIGTEEERAQVLAEMNTSVNPRRISGVIGRWARTTFGNTTQEDLEKQAIEELSKSPVSKNTVKFNEFKKEYDETKDLLSSFDMSGLEIPEYDPKTLSLVETVTENRVSSEGTLVTETFRVSTNRNTGQETKTLKEREIIDIRPEDTEEEITANFFKVSVDLFDLASDTLNSDALRAFSEKAKANNIRYTNPRTIEEYNKLQQILETTLTLENAIKDPSKESIANSIVSQIGTQGLALENLILSLSDDPDERIASKDRILQIYENQLDFREIIAENLKGIDEFPGQE
jgi:hypothetical protein